MSAAPITPPTPPSAATRLDELRRRLRGTSGRGRKVRGLATLLRPYRGRVVAALVALLAGVAATLAPAPLAKYAIDSGIVPGDRSALTLAVGLFLLAAVVYWVASYLQTSLVQWVGQRALADLRLRIFDHLQELPVSFYDRNRAGVLLSRMTNDVDALSSLVTDTIITLVSATLTLAGSIVVLFLLDAELALIALAIVPIVLAGSLAFRIASADAYARTRETIASINAELQEALSGIRVVRSFGQEPRHLRRLHERNDHNRDANMATVRLNAAYFPAVELVGALATVVVLVVGGERVMDDGLQVGVLVGFIAALNGFFDPIGQLSNVYTTYQSGMAALDKIFELLDEEPDLRDAPDARELGVLRGEVELRDVTFAYRSRDREVVALRDVSLHVAPGETVALVGATGAGKSTLAKLVARFHDPTSGSVLVDGVDLREVTMRSLRSQMGIVPQEAFLFSGTIRDNLLFGRPDASDDELDAAVRAVGLDEVLARLAEGLDTEVGERGGSLSAGQRQLVAFARALLADPRILVLDEATSNVDLQSEARLEAGLRRLLHGRTAVVIAHRLSTIRRASRIVVLAGGRIAEVGTHEELLAAGGVYAELHRSWEGRAAA